MVTLRLLLIRGLGKQSMKNMLRNANSLAVLLWLAATAAAARDFHASPNGRPNGDGSQTAPCDLATALATNDVGAGDTLWLHGGTYRGGFESRLTGKPGSPVTIRQAPGERATIDCRPRDAQDS